MRRALLAALALTLAGCWGGPPGLTRPYSEVKREFERVCTGCHSLDPIMKKHRDAAEWEETVRRMKIRGAKVEEWMIHDFPLHLAYIRGK